MTDHERAQKKLRGDAKILCESTVTLIARIEALIVTAKRLTTEAKAHHR